MGKAARDVSNYTYAVAGPIADGACRGHAEDGDKSAEETWSEELKSYSDGQNRERDKRAWQMGFVQVPQGEESLTKKPVAVCFDAEHLVYLTNCNCTPTPVRKPTSTVLERKSARKPRRRILARRSVAPETSAMRLVSSTYRGVLATKERAVSPANTIAAVAESALTTRCREDPKTANTTIGRNIVYSPVITGVPMILVYPITSGIPSAASVMPAMMSEPS